MSSDDIFEFLRSIIILVLIVILVSGFIFWIGFRVNYYKQVREIHDAVTTNSASFDADDIDVVSDYDISFYGSYLDSPVVSNDGARTHIAFPYDVSIYVFDAVPDYDYSSFQDVAIALAPVQCVSGGVGDSVCVREDNFYILDSVLDSFVLYYDDGYAVVSREVF